MSHDSRSRRLVSYRSGGNMDNPVHIHTFDNSPLTELPSDLMALARETLDRSKQGDGHAQTNTRNSRNQYDDTTEFSADVYMNNPLHIFRHSQSPQSEQPPINVFYSHPNARMTQTPALDIRNGFGVVNRDTIEYIKSSLKSQKIDINLMPQEHKLDSSTPTRPASTPIVDESVKYNNDRKEFLGGWALFLILVLVTIWWPSH